MTARPDDLLRRADVVAWLRGEHEDFDRAADAIEAGAVAAAPPLRSVWPTWTVWGNQDCVLALSASSACTWWRVSGGSLSRALQREHGWFVAYSSEALGIPDGDYFVPGPWARLDPRGVWTSADGRHWESVGRTP